MGKMDSLAMTEREEGYSYDGKTMADPYCRQNEAVYCRKCAGQLDRTSGKYCGDHRNRTPSGGFIYRNLYITACDAHAADSCLRDRSADFLCTGGFPSVVSGFG